MATYIVETTANPGTPYEVDEAELSRLQRLGLLLNVPVVVREPGAFDQEVADLVKTPASQTRLALDGVGVGPGGVTDHGNLSGLADDDHPQYLTEGRGDVRYAALGHVHVITDLDVAGTPDDTTFLRGDGRWAQPPAGTGGGVTDHGGLTGLADDDHPLYALADGTRGAFAPVDHDHGIADVTGLQTALDGKAATGHTHTAADLSDASTVGEALVTAASAAAARATLDVPSTGEVDADLAGKADAGHDHNPVGYMAAIGTPVELAITTALEAADSNLLYNDTFREWPYGYTSIAIPAGGDAKTAGGFLGISHGTGPAVTASRLHPQKGGLRNVITATGAAQTHYIRQFVPDVYALEERTFTMCAELVTSGTIDVDVYVQARVNAADADRVLVLDSAQLRLTGAGSRYVACSFTVPNLDATAATWDDTSMMETAFRLVSTASGSRTVDVLWLTVVPGRVAKTPPPSTLAAERAAIEAYYETGFTQFGGLTASSGQKRATATFHTRKALPVALADITVTDLAGNVGKVSTYDLAGVRTDNVAYTAIQGDTNTGDSYRNGFTVVINGSTASGIGFLWTVDNPA